MGQVDAVADSEASGIRGSNLRVKIKLIPEEIAKGVTKQIKVKKHVICNTCQAVAQKIRAVFKPVEPAVEVARLEKSPILSLDKCKP